MKRALVLLAGMTGSFGLLFLKHAPHAQSPPLARPVTVKGIVIGADNGQPVFQGRVTAETRTGSIVTYTDATGGFTLNGVSSGVVRFKVHANNYLAYEVARSGGPSVEAADFVIRLQPPGVIAGRLYDDRGNPAVQALITPLYRHIESDGFMHWIAGSLGRTNDRGEFRLSGMIPGEYILNISGGEGMALFPPGRETGRTPSVLYPGVSQISRAEVVNVRAGQEEQLPPMAFNGAHLGSIQVRVNNPSSEAAKEVTFYCCSQVNVNYETGATNIAIPMRSGEPVPVDSGASVVRTFWPNRVGSYQVTVGWTDANRELRVNSFIEFDGEDVEVPIDLAGPRGRLTLQVLAETPEGGFAPAPAVQVNLGRLTVDFLEGRAGVAPFAVLGLRAKGRLVRSIDGALLVETDAKGQASLSEVTVAKYELHELIGVSDGYYLASARQGDRDALVDGILVTEENSILELALKRGGGIVRGRVSGSGAASADALVMLLPAGPLASSKLTNIRYTTRTDQDGRFEIESIVPGDYRIAAWSQHIFPPWAYRTNRQLDPEVEGAVETSGDLVTVKEAQPLVIELELSE